MINKVILIGNLGRDPEVRRLESGVAVAQFSIATNESYKDKSGEWQNLTEWHNIVCWRYLAEKAERDLKKGKQIYLEGKLTHRKYQDKDGNDRYITEVVANVIRLLGQRDENASGFTPSEASPYSEMGRTENSDSADTKANSTEVKTDLPDDDLPF